MILANDRALFTSVPAISTLALQLVGPSLAAAGQQRLVLANRQAAAGHNPTTAVAQFIALGIVLPRLANSLAAVSQTHWRNHARLTYDRAFAEREANRPSLYALGGSPSTQGSDLSIAQVRGSLFAERLRWGVDNEVNGAAAVSGATIAMGVSLVLFGNTLGRDLTAALLLATAVGIVYGKQQFAQNFACGEAARNAERAVAAHRATAWDNVVLGNPNNFSRWSKRFTKLMSQQEQCLVEETALLAQRRLELLACVSAPLLGAIMLRCAGAQDNGALRTLIVQLPSVWQAAVQVTDFTGLVMGKLLPARASLNDRTLKPIMQVPNFDLNDYITAHALTAQLDGAFLPLADAVEIVLERAGAKAAGRCTLRGDNGRGKSMTLRLLKEKIDAQQALLVPAKLGTLYFEATNLTNVSDGVRAVAVLREAMACAPHVLLIDEWDAHLDPTQKAIWDAALNLYSRPIAQGGGGHLVIEVRHN